MAAAGSRSTGRASKRAPEQGARVSSAQTREMILAAARERFLHYGYKKTTIDEIAADAGIGKGTVYLHFDGKDEIMLNLVLSVKRNITEQMRAIAASLATPEDKLRRMVLAWIGTVYDACTVSPHGAEMVDDVRHQMQRRPDMQERFAAETATQRSLLAGVLQEGARTRTFSMTMDPEKEAQLLMAAFATFFPPYVCPAHPHPRSRAEMEAGANEMMDFLLRGLRNRP